MRATSGRPHARKQAQQRVAKRKQESTRRTKAVRLLATQPPQVCRQRTDCQPTTARALGCPYAVRDVEAMQAANLSRRPAPKQDANGTYAHNGAAQQAGLNTSIHDAGWGSFLTLLA
jgi:putative transposase